MRSMKAMVGFLLFLLLAGAELVWAAGGGEGGSHGVTPTQLKNLFWFTLNFIALVIILYKFVRKPVVSMFKSREENILRQYNELLEKKREAEAKYLELQEKVKNLEKEAQAIYENYVAQGLKEKERIIDEANLQAERIKQQTELYIQQEIEKAKNMLREEVAEAAVKLAEDLLRKNITEEDQKKIYKEFINEIRGRVVH